jgi:hypothetical protein
VWFRNRKSHLEFIVLIDLSYFSDVGLCVPTVASPPAGNKSATADDDDDDWDDDDSSEADDDGRVYKNPRNSPSTECPRDEEQATLLVRCFSLFDELNFYPFLKNSRGKNA